MYELYRIVGVMFAPVCVCLRMYVSVCVLLAVSVFTFCMWNSRAPSHSPLSCIFAVDQCDRGECGKNGSFGTKNALMETMKRKEERDRKKKRMTDRSELGPEKRRWLFPENGKIISCFPIFPVGRFFLRCNLILLLLRHIWNVSL